MSDSLYLKAVIDRLEESFAIIKTEDSQTLLWPIQKLPENLSEGDSITISLQTDALATQKNENLAKDILNEILSNQ